MEKQSSKSNHVVAVSLDDYWKEFSSFDDGGQADDEDDDDASKTPDEGEIEEEWLREAGFHTLVDNELADAESEANFEDLLSTLTARQRAVVQKRLDTVQMSKKRRYLKGKQRADVRDVFVNKPLSSPVENNGDHHSSPVVDSGLNSDRPQVFRGPVHSVPQVQQHHKNVPRTTALPPLTFLRTGHSGGFSLREHSKAIDTESPTSVEVLSYAARTSVIHDKQLVYNNDTGKHDSLVPDNQETSFQEISSRLSPDEDLSTSGPESLNSLSSVAHYVEITDLKEDDRAAVRSLAIIEVAALLDSYNLVPSRRRKPNRKKRKDTVVFGTSLTSLLELDRRRCPGLKIPLIYQWTLYHLHSNGLREVGLMRLGGSIQKTQMLKAEIEKYYITSPTFVENAIQQSSVHEVAAVLKQYIRHLPEPLLTNSHMDAFLQVPNISNIEDQINILNLLVLTLPDVHRELLQELLYFLAKVVEEEEYNRMTLGNVAMIMAPNLFPPPRLKKRDQKNDLTAEVTVAALSSKVTQYLIKYGHFLGSVPSELLKQARAQKQHSSRKHAKRPGRKPKGEKFKIAKEAAITANGSVIRVGVGSLRSQCGVPVPVDDHTTAGDVVQRVARALDSLLDPRSTSPDYFMQQENHAVALAIQRPRTTSEPVVIKPKCLLGAKKPNDCLKDHFLYHIRENTGDRRLDHGTILMGYIGGPGGKLRHGSSWEVRCHH